MLPCSLSLLPSLSLSLSLPLPLSPPLSLFPLSPLFHPLFLLPPPLTDAPILRAFSNQLRYVIGSTAILQTLLVGAGPMTGITVRWLDPSDSLIDRVQYNEVDNNGSTVYELTLPSLGENDGGVYTCVVQNHIGISTQTFELFITGRLVRQWNGIILITRHPWTPLR